MRFTEAFTRLQSSEKFQKFRAQVENSIPLLQLKVQTYEDFVMYARIHHATQISLFAGSRPLKPGLREYYTDFETKTTEGKVIKYREVYGNANPKAVERIAAGQEGAVFPNQLMLRTVLTADNKRQALESALPDATIHLLTPVGTRNRALALAKEGKLTPFQRVNSEPEETEK